MEEEWGRFEDTFISKDAGPVQRADMKKAFYAGASHIIWTSKEMSKLGASKETIVNIMRGLEIECTNFINRQIESETENNTLQ